MRCEYHMRNGPEACPICRQMTKAGQGAPHQIDRDALIEVLRGPYATYEEQADAVMALLGGEV